MDIIEKAARIAVDAHKEQVRKSDNSPYIVHPVMVATKLIEHSFPENVVAAALVHDVLEDTSVSEEELRTELGDEVAAIVRAVSEDKDLSWEERKEQYVETLRESKEGAKAVSVSDKIHNLRSLIDAHKREGSALWGKFNRGKEKKMWFEHLVLDMLRETWKHPLVDEYEALIKVADELD